MLYAAIDIGSNAARLLFANVYEMPKGAVAEKATLVRIPIRLGMDVFRYKKISGKRGNMLLNTIKAFKILIDVYRQEILEEVKQKTGIDILIIDGKQEADIISKNSNIDLDLKHKHTLNVDLGGGSTEFSLRKGKDFLQSISFKVGTIRHLFNQVDEKEFVRMKNWLKELKEKYGWMNCIGSGGNINKLVKLYGEYLDNYITEKQMQKAQKALLKYSLEDRIHTLGLRPDRADVIVPATDILLKVFEWSGTKKMYAPKIGLADGMILSMYYQTKK
jgi:exopolyphosphatase/guanosine-5'-triphosphate,3'-diphosphate pyrophosphatase